ncbi:hypothetical protein ACQP10_03185 [Streptosporangium sandarakinum]|uniref:hypothetical protein n=1 Tax=Streptosporangium sandarakinum TaxID=1260955 RepID=UPI003D94B452
MLVNPANESQESTQREVLHSLGHHFSEVQALLRLHRRYANQMSAGIKHVREELTSVSLGAPRDLPPTILPDQITAVREDLRTYQERLVELLERAREIEASLIDLERQSLSLPPLTHGDLEVMVERVGPPYLDAAPVTVGRPKQADNLYIPIRDKNLHVRTEGQIDAKVLEQLMGGQGNEIPAETPSERALRGIRAAIARADPKEVSPMPVVLYLDNENAYGGVRATLEAALDAFGLQIDKESPIIRGSIWQAFRAVIKRQATPDKLGDAGDAAVAGAKARWYGEPQSQITKAQGKRSPPCSTSCRAQRTRSLRSVTS